MIFIPLQTNTQTKQQQNHVSVYPFLLLLQLNSQTAINHILFSCFHQCLISSLVMKVSALLHLLRMIRAVPLYRSSVPIQLPSWRPSPWMITVAQRQNWGKTPASYQKWEHSLLDEFSRSGLKKPSPTDWTLSWLTLDKYGDYYLDTTCWEENMMIITVNLQNSLVSTGVKHYHFNLICKRGKWRGADNCGAHWKHPSCQYPCGRQLMVWMSSH